MMGQRGDDIGSWSRSDDRVLHARLLERDPTATADLALRELAPLGAWLRRTFPRVDAALLETVADDLILDLGEHPGRYDPDRLPLTSYLHMAARGDVLNALKQEQSRVLRSAPLENVELSASARNTLRAHASDPADTVENSLGDERVEAVLQGFAGRDREVIELIVDGERRTARYAEVLGIEGQPWGEQMREVKRVKDRLKGRMKRLLTRLDDDD